MRKQSPELTMKHVFALVLLLYLRSWPCIRGDGPCSGLVCKDGSCIGNSSLCDRSADCQDGLDEVVEDCDKCQTDCKQDEFLCNSGRCVPVISRCNGRDDCGDRSDEASCHSCMDGSFHCLQSGSCLPWAKVCDGSPDCPDGTDELEGSCRLAQRAPHNCPEFRCSDGQCIPHSWRCDLAQDCTDGSDELDCDQNECLDNNGGCSHLCIDKSLGFVCDCPRGMRLVQDTQCEEIDECLDSDLCSQLCIHKNGTFTCDCHSGYFKRSKTGQCRAGGENALVAFSSGGGVRQMDMVGVEYREVAGGNLGLGPLAVFTANRTLYWGDSKKGSIYMISMNEPSPEPVLLLAGLGDVRGLAVDWLHSLLYWTDASMGSVNVAPLDGLRHRLLIGGLSNPTGVAVEPLSGLLFWAESGSYARIERAGMDGKGRLVLVTSLLNNPVAISLDTPRRLLYWADSGLRTISRVGFDGKHHKTVLQSNGYLDRPFALAVFEGQVFWTDQETRSVCSADKHNGSVFKVLLSDIQSLGGLVVIHSVLQQEGPAVCGHPGQLCPFQCVPRLFGTKLPHFSCLELRGNLTEGQEKSDPVPSAAFYDATFIQLISLIVLLSVLLAALTLWWCRGESSLSMSLGLFTSTPLKESQDPLMSVRISKMSFLEDTQLKADEDWNDPGRHDDATI